MEVAHIRELVSESSRLKQSLEQWLARLNLQDYTGLAAIYHPKARFFPAIGSLCIGPDQIKAYFEAAQIINGSLEYGSLNYRTEDGIIEGHYRFRHSDGLNQAAHFAIKFNAEGKITEHTAAPLDLTQWNVRNEVPIGIFLTATTVQSVLNRTQALIG